MQLGQYLRNLMTAICGSNPFQMELDRVREEYEKTAERVARLDELCSEFRAGQSEDARKTAVQIGSLQRLVENYRRRLAEKDDLIASMKEDFRKQEEDYKTRLSAYSLQISSLQQRLDGTRNGRTKQPRRKPKRSNEHRTSNQDAQA